MTPLCWAGGGRISGITFRAGSEQPSAYRRVWEKCLEAVFACAYPSGAVTSRPD